MFLFKCYGLGSVCQWHVAGGSTTNAPPPGLSGSRPTLRQLPKCLVRVYSRHRAPSASSRHAAQRQGTSLSVLAVVCVLVIRCLCHMVPSLDTEDVVTHRISYFLYYLNVQFLITFLCVCFSEFDPKTIIIKFLFIKFVCVAFVKLFMNI